MNRLVPGLAICGFVVLLAIVARGDTPPAADGSPVAMSTVAAEPPSTEPGTDETNEAQDLPNRLPPSARRLLQEDPESWRRRLTNPPSRVAPPSLTPELMSEYLAVVADIDVEMARRFREMQIRDPAALEKRLLKARRLHDLVRLRRIDPHLYQLKLIELNVDKEVSRLAHELRHAHESGRKADFKRIESQLRMQLLVQMAMRHQSRVDYVCELQEVAKRLEEELDAERRYLDEHANALVEDRIRELLQGPPSSGRPHTQRKLSARPAAPAEASR